MGFVIDAVPSRDGRPILSERLQPLESKKKNSTLACPLLLNNLLERNFPVKGKKKKKTHFRGNYR